MLISILTNNLEGVKQEALDINPRLSVFVLSALTGDGLEPFLQYLVRFREKAISPDA